jgi:hypothetical protein
MKSDFLAEQIRKLIVDHHDAFVVELFGGRALAADRIRELIDAGHVTTDQLAGFMVPGLENDVDYYEYVHMISKIFDSTPPTERHLLRGWTPDQWSREIDQKHTELWGQPRPEPGEGVTVRLPEPAVEPVAFAAPEPAPWMSANEAHAYESAHARAGVLAQQLRDGAVNELEVLRAATATAVAEHDDPAELAREMMRRTGDWEHNWERIARTEIQGAYNEGRVMDALENYGPDAQIAKITETRACSACLRLHRDADGKPRVFSVRELIDNGTNVGRRRSDWRPTIWPVHPNCRCDTMIVPPGLTVGEYGELL